MAATLRACCRTVALTATKDYQGVRAIPPRVAVVLLGLVAVTGFGTNAAAQTPHPEPAPGAATGPAPEQAPAPRATPRPAPAPVKPHVVATPRPAATATPRPTVAVPHATAKPRVTAAPRATAVPRATAAAPVVRATPPVASSAPVRHRATRHRAAHRATPAPTAAVKSSRVVTAAPRPAVHASGDDGDGRRMAVAGLTLLGLALTSAGFLILTMRDQHRSPRT